MYGKLFVSMYEGSLYGNWEAIVTFQQMICLANRDGVVDMTPAAIAGKTSIPLEIIERGIAHLVQPDPESRSPECDGRRIETLDLHRSWGWRIVNYEKYRRMSSMEDKLLADRERIQQKRRDEKVNKIHDVAECRKVSREVVNVAYAEADAKAKRLKTNTSLSDERGASDSNGNVPTWGTPESLVALYNSTTPDECPAITKLTEARRKKAKLYLRQFPDQEFWQTVCTRIHHSWFLRGLKTTPGHEHFKASFDWLLTKGKDGTENVVKVYEGRYQD